MKIKGSYTIKIADKESGDLYAGSVVTVEVTTDTVDAATTVADALGATLEKLGLSIPQANS
jgi:hypothetical protein